MTWKKNNDDEYVTVEIQLQPKKKDRRLLRQFIDLWITLYNIVNYYIKQQYLKDTFRFIYDTQYRNEIFRKAYFIYYTNDETGLKKIIGSATVQRIIDQRKGEWKGFVESIKEYYDEQNNEKKTKKHGKSKKKKKKKYTGKPNPPGYRKYYTGGKKGKRIPYGVILRQDQIDVDPKKHTIKLYSCGILKGVELQFKGRIIYDGEFTELVIWYDEHNGKFYGRLTIRNPKKRLNGKKWEKYPLEPKGVKITGIDLGVNNFLSLYVYDPNGNDFGLTITGSRLKSLSFYFRHRIRLCQKILDLKKNNKLVKICDPNTGKCEIKYLGEEELNIPYDKLVKLFNECNSQRIRKLYRKWKRQMRQFIDTMINQIIQYLYELGVKEIVVGYPKYLIRNTDKSKGKYNKTGRFEISRVFSYRYTLNRIKTVARRYGIIVHEVNEAYTSKLNPLLPDDKFKQVAEILGEIFDVDGEGVGESPPLVPEEFLGTRRKGVFKSFPSSREFNSDVVGAFNIVRLFVYFKYGKIIRPDLNVLDLSGGNLGKILLVHYSPVPGSPPGVG